MARAHHNLAAWQQAIALVKAVYTLSEQFPPKEAYGLTSQMRRAAVSIPSNIAEGAAGNSSKEFAHFLTLARGSLSELETQVVISRELGYIKDSAEIDALMDRVFRLVAGLIASNRKTASP